MLCASRWNLKKSGKQWYHAMSLHLWECGIIKFWDPTPLEFENFPPFPPLKLLRISSTWFWTTYTCPILKNEGFLESLHFGECGVKKIWDPTPLEFGIFSPFPPQKAYNVLFVGEKGGKFRFLMGWGPKFLWRRTPQSVSFPKSPHFSKSDKCKWSKIRGNFIENQGELYALVGKSVDPVLLPEPATTWS